MRGYKDKKRRETEKIYGVESDNRLNRRDERERFVAETGRVFST